MPVYEYYCKRCDGVFEAIRTMAQASTPAPCPECGKKAERIPPTSFAAFTMREGYPRAIPDRGTYWHLGKEVKRPITGKARMNEHPEINKPQPPPRKSKGDLEALADKREAKRKEEQKMRESGITPPVRRGVLADDD